MFLKLEINLVLFYKNQLNVYNFSLIKIKIKLIVIIGKNRYLIFLIFYFVFY